MGRISIVIPNRGMSSLVRTVQSILQSNVEPCEIIVWDKAGHLPSSADIALVTDACTVVKGDENPLQARILGTKCAKGEYVLFLDSDQTVDPSLISELSQVGTICAVVPETVEGRGFSARAMGDKKLLSYLQFQANPALTYPVAPRLYRRHELIEAFEYLSAQMPLCALWQHEDSVLFWAIVTRQNKPLESIVYFARSHIANESISLVEIIKKAGIYGNNRGNFTRMLQRKDLPEIKNILRLLSKMDAWRPPVDPTGRLWPFAAAYDLVRVPTYAGGYLYGRWLARIFASKSPMKVG